MRLGAEFVSAHAIVVCYDVFVICVPQCVVCFMHLCYMMGACCLLCFGSVVGAVMV